MAVSETVTMRLDCPESLTVGTQFSSDASNGGFGESHGGPQQSQLHQQNSNIAEVATSADIVPIDSNSTILDEIRDLREQIQRVKIQTSIGSSNAKEDILQCSPDESDKLQRIKNCLRKHWHEWDDRDGLEAFSSENSLQQAIDHLQFSSAAKARASAHIARGSKKKAARLLNNLTESDDEDDEDDSDGEEQYLRQQLMLKRREHMRSMELNVESITEEMVRMRLRRRLRQQEKAAKLELEDEVRAAKQQEQHKNDSMSTADGGGISADPEPIIYAAPKAKLVDWNSFKDLRRVAESISCVVDVLVGEPVVEKENREHSWKRRDRLAEKPQAQKPNITTVSSGPRGQGPLPERIRIHSSLFLNIFAKLIDPDGVKLDLSGEPVIFLRPFKAITHYEYRLREWLARREENIEKHGGTIDPSTEVNDDDKELGERKH